MFVGEINKKIIIMLKQQTSLLIFVKLPGSFLASFPSGASSCSVSNIYSMIGLHFQIQCPDGLPYLSEWHTPVVPNLLCTRDRLAGISHYCRPAQYQMTYGLAPVPGPGVGYTTNEKHLIERCLSKVNSKTWISGVEFLNLRTFLTSTAYCKNWVLYETIKVRLYKK